MRWPRQSSRSGRAHGHRLFRAGATQDCARSAVTGVRSFRNDDAWDDPGHLIESYFMSRRHTNHDPDTVVLAWLSVLSPAVEPPLAARSLIRRLKRGTPDHQSHRKDRLVDLLAFIAAHRRNPEN